MATAEVSPQPIVEMNHVTAAVTSTTTAAAASASASTSASASAATSCNARYWQVFFIPKDCASNPNSFVAYCPYTKISAEGSCVLEAAYNWRKQAKHVLRSYCDIPKYMITPTKLLYGEQGGIPFYAISCNKSPNVQSYELFSPAGINVKSIPSSNLPTVWMDWCVDCTPLNDMGPLSTRHMSLTPHCIN
ncbi:hypothetical protein Pelo_457 [Pelomyxa schiedti]|nr:hypothetical protein Pelo_457 [Pelomyxa schiedti]